MNKLEFLHYVQDKCERQGIVFKTNNEKTILTEVIKSECSGFFEENSKIQPTLGIAGGLEDKNFFEVLAHEFCHSQQWNENSPYWINSRITLEEQKYYSKKLNKDTTGFETGDIFHLWLDGVIELSNEELDSLIERTTGVEFDCERRTLNLINEFNLDINTTIYAQKSNAYLLTYFFARKERIWTTAGKATYILPEIYEKMPTTIDPEFCKNITPDLIQLIKRHCL